MRKFFKAVMDEEIICLDTSQEDSEVVADVFIWLMKEREDILSDVDFHEGGNIEFDREGSTITVSGDNGLFVLEEVEVTTL